MSLAKFKVLSIVMLLLAVSVVGCGKKEKMELADLRAQYNDLSANNNDLRDQLAKAKASEAELMAQVDAKNLQIDSLGSQLRSSQDKLALQSQTTSGGWEVGLTADRVTVGTDILFSAGRASLTSKGKSALDAIVSDLKSSYSDMPVRVYGYTDSDPIKKTKNLWKDNLDLSANRAMAVTRYLTNKGINASSVETIAMGKELPIASNDSKAGKAKNRRVEIIVIKE